AGRMLRGLMLPGRTLPGRMPPGRTPAGRTLPGRTRHGRTPPGPTRPGPTLPGRTPLAENEPAQPGAAAAPLRPAVLRRRCWSSAGDRRHSTLAAGSGNSTLADI